MISLPLIQLNAAQRKIFQISEGKHIVQAPAGCGKTEVLTLRVIEALNNGMDANKMICLTFTNRAAREMRDRLNLGKNDVFIGNIHRYCERFLQANGLIPGNTSLLDEVEYKYVLNGLIRKHGNFPEFQRHRVFNFIVEKKRELLGIENMRKNYAENLSESNISAMNEIFYAYEKLKSNYLLLDFDDLLSLSIFHLRTQTDRMPPFKMTDFEWLQVDEAQDLNPAQWEIIRLIAPNYHCAVLFGDAEQSIFSFLGSDQNAFVKLLKRSENIHFLDENFRSKNNPAIISLLNAFLKQTIGSQVQFHQDNTVLPAPQDNFQFYQIPGELQNEISFIATKLLTKIDPENETTAIIVRANSSAETISEELQQRNIPHFKVSGKDFFETEEIKNLKAFLQILISPFDLLSWSRVLRFFSNNKSLDDARKEVFGLYQSGLTPHDILMGEMSMMERLNGVYQEGRIIVFDTETTGLDTDEADIIQIAAIELVNGEFSREFEVYIHTDEEKLKASESIHHISFTTLKSKGIAPKTALEQFTEFVGKDAVLLAHNLDFDQSMLFSFYRRHDVEMPSMEENKVVDSLVISRLIYTKERKHSLENLIETLRLEGANTHNALDDVRATVSLVHRLNLDMKDKILHLEEKRKTATNQWRTFIKNFEPLYRETRKKYLMDVPLSTIIETFSQFYFQAHHQEDKRWRSWLRIIQSYEKDLPARSLRMHLLEKWREFSSLKEVDLIDEKVKLVVTTAHKAKGLSFDNVIICEAVDGVYPHFSSSSSEMQQEEKRVLYVALSRAKKRLFITTHDTFITSYGNQKHREPSPFLKDILPFFNQTSHIPGQ